jgi:hypothetical protein
MPKDEDLIDAGQLVPSEKTAKIFRIKQVEPVFIYPRSGLQYCRFNKDSTIHIINPGLFSYFIDYDVTEEITSEFSYKVAKDTIQFVAWYDAGLIPINFYRYWQRDQKIINYSYIDIRRPDRKIFIKPYFYVYNSERQEYISLVSDKSAVSFADKIRNGETLDISLTRIVRDDLKLCDNYERAKVSNLVSFDRDRDNILTPLLHVDIYLESANISPEIKQQSQRGWVSIDKAVN